MRISDWSSDVCSSDLVAGVPLDALLVELLALVGGELVTVEPVGDLLGHELEGGVGPPERLRVERVVLVAVAVVVALDRPVDVAHVAPGGVAVLVVHGAEDAGQRAEDRKSTRLNSSH